MDLQELLSPVVPGSVSPEELPCVGAGPDLFFSESPAELETAKLLCGRCPVQRACLEGAIARAEPWGVWGGQVFDRGRPIPFKRPRGRPRKNAVPPVPVVLQVQDARAS